jgi:hypothetical protein
MLKVARKDADVVKRQVVVHQRAIQSGVGLDVPEYAAAHAGPPASGNH